MSEKRGMSLRCYLKTASDSADVTWGGRSFMLFHVLAPETGKARLLRP